MCSTSWKDYDVSGTDIDFHAVSVFDFPNQKLGVSFKDT
jgi:hypothetical protein